MIRIAIDILFSRAYINSMTLVQQILEIFPSFNYERFRKENSGNTDVILQSILDAIRIGRLRKRLIAGEWHLRVPTRSEKMDGRAFIDIETKEIAFSLPWKTMPYEDLRFIVFHEFGHVVDVMAGRFYMDENDNVIFNNEEVSETAIQFAMIFDDDVLYCSLPHELSANRWALKSGVVPLLERTLVCYKTATGEIEPVEINCQLLRTS